MKQNFFMRFSHNSTTIVYIHALTGQTAVTTKFCSQKYWSGQLVLSNGKQPKFSQAQEIYMHQAIEIQLLQQLGKRNFTWKMMQLKHIFIASNHPIKACIALVYIKYNNYIIFK